jgi:hypothetical protein
MDPPPMRPVDTGTTVPPRNPLHARYLGVAVSSVVLGTAYFRYLSPGASWSWTVLVALGIAGMWCWWTWRSYRAWRRWRDGPRA